MAGLWYEDAVFYGMDIRRFQDSNGDGFGDLPGLISRLDYLAELGITALWLLPFLDTPFGDNGYDVRDYYRIDPRVGDLNDFVHLIDEAKKRNIRLVMDLVVNHTSNQHPWFEAARREPLSVFRNYYVWTETIPEETLNDEPIFPGEEESVWTYDPVAKAYYFHRFYHFQPDLRTSNPAVQSEIMRIMDYWLAMGVDGFRIDAAPIMLDPKGLESTRMEDPHQLLRDIHDFAIKRKTDVVLLGEANVQMDLMDEFFGGGSEMTMLFNFLLGPHILLAFARQNSRPLRDYLEQLLFPPDNDQWLNFLRNLDELSLEKMPPELNDAIYEAFAPQEEMKIYNRGIRRRIAPMLSNGAEGIHREKLELAYSLLLSTPGTPIIMYGDEIGMGEDLSLPGRNSVRTPMQWSNEKNAGFSTADELVAPVISDGPFGFRELNVSKQLADQKSLIHFMKQIIAIRIDSPEIGLCPVSLIEVEENDDRVMAHCYRPESDHPRARPQVFFHNLSSDSLTATIHLDHEISGSPSVRLGRGKITQARQRKITVELPPYGYLWVQE